jgi:hypothetical protein
MGEREYLKAHCTELNKIRENVARLHHECEAHAKAVESAGQLSHEPGLTPRENLNFVLIQLERVSKYLAQLEAAYSSYVFDVLEAETRKAA